MCKRVFSYVCLTSSMNRASLTLVVFLPRDTCSAFMLLVFCSFDKTVHAAITVCTWLYIMWCPSNWRTRAQPIISYVIPLMIPSRLVTCTYSRENFRSPLFSFKIVLIDSPSIRTDMADLINHDYGIWRCVFRNKLLDNPRHSRAHSRAY